MSSPGREAWVVVVPSTGQSETLSAELVGEAKRVLGAGVVRALAIGHHVAPDVDVLGKWGLGHALVIDDPALATYHPERFARAVGQAVQGADPALVLFPGTVLGSDLGARVAAELGRRFHSGGVDFELVGDEIRVTRRVAQGRLQQTETASGAPHLLALVPDTVGPGAPGRPARVETQPLPITVDNLPTTLRDLGFAAADPRTVDIVDAEIIVAGGRGVGGAQGFALLEEIAGQLGASLGASRPAVEAGWAPYERQVGQTGRVVRPKLYMACGISGATQHLAGMREAETIIAINIDPNAPILGLATLGVEGDLHAVLAALAAQLRARVSGVA